MQLLWKIVAIVKRGLPFNTRIILLVLYPREIKTNVHTKSCAQVFIAAINIIAKREKQPKCLSGAEQVNEMRYIHTA